jgi:Na+/H+ antiporter NhaD/arsenite permease-like protein
MIGTGVLTLDDIFTDVNWTAIGVLLGMFIIASSLREAGFFEWMGLRLAGAVDAHPIRMYILLPLMTAGMASLLDIVTVALFIVPLTVQVFDSLDIDPVPFVITEVLAANIGGVSTMVGDPTNVIVGSTLGVSFNQFLLNTAPIALAALAANTGILYIKNHGFLHREALVRRRSRLEPLALKTAQEAVKDSGLLRVSLVSLGLAVAFLIVHNFLGVSAALATLAPAFLILVYESSRSKEIQHVLGRVDWEIFFFFGGLFLLVGGLAKTGVLATIGDQLVQLAGGNLALTVTLVLWVAALISQVVDNVPLVTAFIPIILRMELSFPNYAPIAWALALGTGIGGMATPIGTASNMVALNILNKPNQRLSFARFAKRTIPLTILDLAIANLILVLRL